MAAALLHSPLTLFIVQVGVIIALSRGLGRLGRRLGQPMVVAEIVAGILLGPSLLGWAAPAVSAALFPKTSLGLLNLCSQVGLIFFMFLVGLELDPRLLRGRGQASILISQSGILVPFTLGGLLAPLLYRQVSGPPVSFLSFLLFMGVSMSITAFPVLARILSERRLLRSKVGAVTITCAAVDDVTAWCVLAFVICVARASGLRQAVLTTVLALGYLAVMAVLVRPFLRRLGARSTNREGLTQDLVAVVFLLLLLSSWTTELIGIHALFGAFMLGAMMPKDGPFAQVLSEKLEDFAVVFLLPLFFAFSGLRTQLGLIHGPAWGLCGLIVLCACAGKFGGSALAARITGLSWRESSALGILMNTRGLMELVVLNIGLDIGVISPLLFTMMVLMALFTTFLTTPLLAWVYPPEALARETIDVPPRPAPPRAGFSVMLCVSYERAGGGMLALSRALWPAPAAPPLEDERRLYVLKLVRPTDRPSFYLDEDAERQGDAVLAAVNARAQALGLSLHPLSFVSSDPAEDICSVAEAKGVDLLLLGWHKPLLTQAVLGGTVQQVLAQARPDVGVLVDRGLDQVRQVLVPYYGGEHDRAALRLARRLARAGGARVTVLHVVRPTGARGKLGAREQVDEVFHEPGLKPGQVTLRVVEHDSPPEAALAEAALGYDLVLVGIGREWGLEHRLFGLYPEALVRRCPTSLLVVRGARGAA